MAEELSHVTQRLRRARVVLAAVGLALCLLQSASAEESNERLTVPEVKPLLMLAAERGEAHGSLNGPGADYVRRRFDVATPIEIEVRRLRQLPQSGCGRLEVTTRQRAVLEAGARHDQVLTYQVSFCRDGHFPKKR